MDSSPAKRESTTERLGEAVGQLSGHPGFTRLLAAVAGVVMLILAGVQADKIGPQTPESVNAARGLTAAGFAIASSLCFLAGTRRS